MFIAKFNFKKYKFRKQQCKIIQKTHIANRSVLVFFFLIANVFNKFFPSFFCRSILWLIGWYIIIYWQFSFSVCVCVSMEFGSDVLYFKIFYHHFPSSVVAREKERENVRNFCGQAKPFNITKWMWIFVMLWYCLMKVNSGNMRECKKERVSENDWHLEQFDSHRIRWGAGVR